MSNEKQRTYTYGIDYISCIYVELKDTKCAHHPIDLKQTDFCFSFHYFQFLRKNKYIFLGFQTADKKLILSSEKYIMFSLFKMSNYLDDNVPAERIKLRAKTCVVQNDFHLIEFFSPKKIAFFVWIIRRNGIDRNFLLFVALNWNRVSRKIIIHFAEEKSFNSWAHTLHTLTHEMFSISCNQFKHFCRWNRGITHHRCGQSFNFSFFSFNSDTIQIDWFWNGKIEREKCEHSRLLHYL